ncbi:MAG: hypothetical protein GY786_19575, partial [Proteobacteria bacterium]|nr:hypothetical protein [Pseudomonadota bacterium]
MANYGQDSLSEQEITCRICDDEGKVYYEKSFISNIKQGDVSEIGSIHFNLKNINLARKLQFWVGLNNSEYCNFWDFWVYPENITLPDNHGITISDGLDEETISSLENGNNVLLFLSDEKVTETNEEEIKMGFSSIFWNTDWTDGQAPHTMGILCNPEDPLFKHFPTESHSNWQWWELINGTEVMHLDFLEKSHTPMLQVIDTWFNNRKLGLLYECRVGTGSLIVCSIPLEKLSMERVAARQ